MTQHAYINCKSESVFDTLADEITKTVFQTRDTNEIERVQHIYHTIFTLESFGILSIEARDTLEKLMNTRLRVSKF